MTTLAIRLLEETDSMMYDGSRLITPAQWTIKQDRYKQDYENNGVSKAIFDIVILSQV